jgi:hypothetical protein
LATKRKGVVIHTKDSFGNDDPKSHYVSKTKFEIPKFRSYVFFWKKMAQSLHVPLPLPHSMHKVGG